MNASKPFAIILHVRVPTVLRGGDQQRYLERKFRDYGLRLRPPPTLIGTDVPVGYGLVRPGMDGWDVVEAPGEVEAGVTLIELIQHELVEDALDEALERQRRAQRAAKIINLPFEDEPEGGIAIGGPAPGRIATAALAVASILFSPITLAARALQRLRRWYVREHG